MKFPTLSLSTSCQTHPRLTLLWSSQTTFLKTTLIWILNSKFPPTLWAQPPDMCLVQSLIPTMALRLNIVIWTLNSTWNIPTYTCLLMYLRTKKVQQTAMLLWTVCRSQHAYPSMNETRQFAVAAYCDYRTRSYKTAAP